MAYSPINNNKFDSGDVIDGADIAQLNDNIEDTRTLTVNQYATVYEWANHSEVGQINDTEVGTEGFFTFETPTTTTYFGSKQFDFLTGGLPDNTGTLFGDNINCILYFDYDFSSDITSANTYTVPGISIEYVMADGEVKTSSLGFISSNGSISNSLSGSNNAGSGRTGVQLYVGYDFPAKIGALQSIRIMDAVATNTSGQTKQFKERITPTKLEIKVNS